MPIKVLSILNQACVTRILRGGRLIAPIHTEKFDTLSRSSILTWESWYWNEMISATVHTLNHVIGFFLRQNAIIPGMVPSDTCAWFSTYLLVQEFPKELGSPLTVTAV